MKINWSEHLNAAGVTYQSPTDYVALLSSGDKNKVLSAFSWLYRKASLVLILPALGMMEY